MKMLAIVGWLTLFPASTGVYAARLWYLSSKLYVRPTWKSAAGLSRPALVRPPIRVGLRESSKQAVRVPS